MVSVPSIAAVSYLNTIPFIYGIRHEGNFRADLLLSPPSECTKNYVEGRADLALLPAAAVPSLKSTDVITEYCIGAVGPVRTVVLLSDGPVSEVRRSIPTPRPPCNWSVIWPPIVGKSLPNGTLWMTTNSFVMRRRGTLSC